MKGHVLLLYLKAKQADGGCSGETKHFDKGSQAATSATAGHDAQTGISVMWLIQQKQQGKVNACCVSVDKYLQPLSDNRRNAGECLYLRSFTPPSPLSFPSVCGSTVFLSCSLILSEAAVGCQPVKLKLWSPSLP